MYQMKSTDISIIAFMQMYKKRLNYILRAVFFSYVLWKKIETLIICHHFKYFAASGNFYTLPNNVLEIFL